MLGHEGFYTLLAQGWSLDDFSAPYPRGRISLDAELSERIVGLFDLERASGVIMSAADANASIRDHYARLRVTTGLPDLTDEHLSAIRRRRGELLARWSELAPGEAIELTFPR